MLKNLTETETTETQVMIVLPWKKLNGFYFNPAIG